MRVLLTSDARFERTPDGAIWGPPACGHALWMRYLSVFSQVMVAARVRSVPRPSAGCVVASRSDVRFWPLPAYSGLAGMLGDVPELHASLTAAVQRSQAIIVRAPSFIAYLAGLAAIRTGRPFGAEIVGDADQVFAPGAFRHPLRGAIRVAAAAAERQISHRAAAVLFVTSEVLQRRYPTAGRSYAASDGALDDDAFSGECLREWRPPAAFVLVTVGGLDQPFKGTAVLLDAMSMLRRRAAPAKLRVVGGGRLMPHLQRLSDARGLSDDVEFLGQRDVAGVREALDSAHLFVLPSLTEGLPRALLEAMARGLPAVATNVGGVPELLPADCLVPPGDARALAAGIERMMADSGARQTMGERNRAHALTHHERRQAVVRRQFLQAVKDVSAQGCTEVRCA
jgi:glycosyltransferase involved in cell wall biosynthesis